MAAALVARAGPTSGADVEREDRSARECIVHAVGEAERDDDRYLEYLQDQLLTDPGWLPAFEKLQNRSGIPPKPPGLDDADPIWEVEARFRSFTPRTQYELPLTQQIFAPLLDDILDASKILGLKPVAGIRLATSTDMSAGPVSRPGAGGHHLLIGPGTWSFCNYWAKVISEQLHSIGTNLSGSPIVDRGQILEVARSNPEPLRLAVRLAINHSAYGSLVGFGVVDQPKELALYRSQLLRSMETFALAHEYSHFVAEERASSISGHDLEHFCDAMGIQLARNCPGQNDTWLSFVCAGALVFFHSTQFCTEAETIMTGGEAASSDSHPPLHERIVSVTKSIVNRTAEDQRPNVEKFVDEYNLFLEHFFGIALDLVHTVLRTASDTPETPP